MGEAVIAALSITDVFQITAAGVGIIGVLTGAAVYTRSRLSMELLRNDLEDARNREKDLRQSIADLKEEKAHVEGENDQLKQRVKTIEDLITKAPDIAALAAEVRTFHQTIRSDYAHFAPALQMLVQERVKSASSDTSRAP